MSHLYTPERFSCIENRMVIDSHWPQGPDETENIENDLEESRNYHLRHPEDFIQFVAENHIELLEPLVTCAMNLTLCESSIHSNSNSVTIGLYKAFNKFIDLEMEARCY